MKFIGCFTGGGVRGVLTACMLVELEKQTGKLTRDVFSFLAGTSTGAIIAASCAVGLPAAQILDLYEKRTKEIFNHNAFNFPYQLGRGYSYDPGNIGRVLKSEFGNASKWTMNDVPLKIMLTATGMNGHKWYFVPSNPKNSGLTARVSLISAAVASASAPFVFDHAHALIAGQDVRLFDGGISGLANPTYQAAIEAFDFDSYVPSETRIITCGTGFFPAPDVPPAGLQEVILWTIDTLIDSSEDEVDRTTERQWPGLNKKLNWQLSKPVDMGSLDDIPDLVAMGTREAAKIDWQAMLQ